MKLKEEDEIDKGGGGRAFSYIILIDSKPHPDF